MSMKDNTGNEMAPIDFDSTWKEPTDAQIAAIHHVYRCLGKKKDTVPPQGQWHTLVLGEANRRAWMVDHDHFDYELGPFDYAEMMLTADRSLWYSQAKAWAEKGPDKYGEEYQRIAEIASSFVKSIVEWGYQDGAWWDLAKIEPDVDKRTIATVALLDFNRMNSVSYTHLRAHET